MQQKAHLMGLIRLVTLCGFCGLWPGLAVASYDLCQRAVVRASETVGVPRNVLMALARTETGRGPNGDPWPWSINREGEGFVFQSQAEALQFARASAATGRTSFDTGCFQVNYRWHRDAFESLEQMLDPVANAIYAARFLARLYDEKGSWPDAAAAYHSRTPRYANAYRTRFLAQLARIGDAPPAPVRVAALAVNRFPLLQQRDGSAAPGSLVKLQDR